MTSEWRFDAVLEPMSWGGVDYTVIRVPADLESAARAWPTHRVEGRIDETPVNAGINRAPADVIDTAFIYVGKGLRRRLQARAGDVVTCRLRPVDPDHVPVPEDVGRALQEAGSEAAFERRTPAQRRRLLVPVEDAVRDATRAQRIAALVRSLGGSPSV